MYFLATEALTQMHVICSMLDGYNRAIRDLISLTVISKDVSRKEETKKLHINILYV